MFSPHLLQPLRSPQCSNPAGSACAWNSESSHRWLSYVALCYKDTRAEPRVAMGDGGADTDCWLMNIKKGGLTRLLFSVYK